MNICADAVVIGAGIAGSYMACALAARGWDVVLIDKESYPRHKACGEFLSPESLSSLRALGLDETLRSCGPAFMNQARLHSERGVSLAIPLPGQAWGLSRFALDARMQGAARERGARFLPSCPVVGVTRIGTGGYRVECGLPDRRTSFEARIVVGAGGRHSWNDAMSERGRGAGVSAGERAGAGLGVGVGEKTFVGIKCHYAGGDRTPAVDLYFFEGGYVGIAPVEGGRLNVAAILPRDAAPRHGVNEALERLLDQAARRIPALRERLEGARPVPGTAASAYPVTIGRAPEPWGEYPRVGDAAAVIPPFCGDGMAMALRSAELCAPLADAYLRGEIALEAWRGEYVRLLEKQFAGVLRWSRRLERGLSRAAPASWLLRLGALAPGMARRMVSATRLKG